MSEKLEQVSRALCRQYEIDEGFSVEQADRAAAGEMHRNFLKAARAAIEAMRAMPICQFVALPVTEADGRTEISSFTVGEVQAVWHALIDEALK